MPDSPPPIGFRKDFLPPESQQNNLVNLAYSPMEFVQQTTMPVPAYPILPSTDDTHNPNQTNLQNSSSSSSSSSDADEIYEYHGGMDTSIHDIEEDGCTWQLCSCSGPFPENMIRAGTDTDGSPIFAGRAFHEGDMIPAKVIPSKSAVYVSYGGEEIPKDEFEVLRSGEFVWEFCTNGAVPEGAIQMGQTADGETLYMGRAMYEGSQTPGKVQPSHGCLYMPYGGQEVSVTEYEVLCLK